MSDWQKGTAACTFINTFWALSGTTGGFVQSSHIGTSGAVWPAANRALYLPFEVSEICTVYQIGFEVTVQSGNLDVGIYREDASRVISKGSTAVAAAGVQVVNITDTTLTPGAYFIAMCVDNGTAAFRSCSTGTVAEGLRTIGIQQQAVGAVTLPDPATFANPASAYVPYMYASTMQATI